MKRLRLGNCHSLLNPKQLVISEKNIWRPAYQPQSIYYFFHIMLCNAATDEQTLGPQFPCLQKEVCTESSLMFLIAKEFASEKFTLCNIESLLSEEFNQISFKHSAPLAHISAYYFQIINYLT